MIMMTKNKYLTYGIFALTVVGIIILAGCIKTTPLLIKYDANINEVFSVNNNEVRFKTFSEAKGEEVCEIKYLISEKEKEELINTITKINFFILTSANCPIAVGPQYLNITLGEKFNSVDTRCPSIADEVIYKLEEFTANHEAQLKEECATDYMPRYSFCGAGTSNVHKVKESWVENGKNCICQSYENVVCK